MSLAQSLELEADTSTVAAARFTVTSATVGVVEKRVSDVFLERVRDIAADVNMDASLDFAFRTIDKWLRTQQFDRCDEVLRRVDVGAFHEDLLVGLLTITFAAKERLPSRSRLLQRTSTELKHRIGADEARRALVGLE